MLNSHKKQGKQLESNKYLNSCSIPSDSMQASQPQQLQQCIIIPISASGPLQQATAFNVLPGYASLSAIVLGWIQVILGITSFILGVISVVQISGLFFFVGHGIWCGILFIIAGSLTIPAGQYKTSCLIVSSMVMSIITAVFGLLLFALTVTEIAFGPTIYCDFECVINRPAFYSVHILMLLVGVAEMIFAIWTSVVACRTTCCTNTLMPEDPAYQVQHANINQMGQMGQVMYAGNTTTPQGQVMYAMPPSAMHPTSESNTGAIGGTETNMTPTSYSTLGQEEDKVPIMQ